jgi:5-methylcytosine-specific restriction endonuclease McrA
VRPKRPCANRECRRLHREAGGLCVICQSLQAAADTERRRALEPWRDACYKDPRWAVARRGCFTRDGYQCRAKLADGSRCPEIGGLQAHHTVPLHELWGQGGDPFAVALLLTLCPDHHGKADAALRRDELNRPLPMGLSTPTP